MEIQTLLNYVIIFFLNHMPVFIVAAAIMIYLVWQKPKAFLMLLMVFSLLLGVIYIISEISDIGEPYKKKLIQKSDQARGDVGIVNDFEI